jgi:signal transduction histidine kinase/ligand-binding sensor domain-containing protein
MIQAAGQDVQGLRPKAVAFGGEIRQLWFWLVRHALGFLFATGLIRAGCLDAATQLENGRLEQASPSQSAPGRLQQQEDELPPAVERNLKFTHISIEDGLSQANVWSIVRDRQGFMWFGTQMGGLNRYDAYEFKVYQHDLQDDRSLSHNYIQVLYEDRRGALWIGFGGGGLDRYNRETDTFVHYRHNQANPNSIPGNNVNTLYEDRTGVLWVGSDGGISRMDRERGTFFTYKHDPNDPNSLSDDWVRSICEDQATGLFWLGTRRGGVSVFERRTGRFIHYTNIRGDSTSLSGNEVNHVYQDRALNIWVSTRSGLNRFDPKTRTFIRYKHDANNPESLSDDYVSMTYEDTRGRFWVATMNGLDLLEWNTGTFTHCRHASGNPDSLCDDAVRAVYEDDTGAVWFGTANGGVSRLASEAKKFVTWRHNLDDTNSLSHNAAQAIHEDSTGRLWVGTAAGLNRFDGRNFTRYLNNPQDPHSLSANNVIAIEEDARGVLWFGTSAGLNRFDGTGFTRYQNEPSNLRSLSGNAIDALCADDAGGLWISVHGIGLDYFNGRAFTHYRRDKANPHSLPTYYVHGIVRDRKGTIWLASTDAWLIRFDPAADTFTPYLFDPAHPITEAANQVHALFADTDGSIWVGADTGLFRFSPISGRFIEHYTRSDGMPANVVASILSDNQGYLWLGTTAGLSRFDPRSHTFRNYDQSDGLQGNQFTGYACGRRRNGQMFFGGPNGLSAFFPDRLQDNPHAPPIVLTDFELFDRPLEIGGKDSPLRKAVNVAETITLKHHQSVFGFRFAALNYTSPEKNRYAYKMDRVDADWRYTDAKRRFVNYTKLDPGTYVFRVRGSNNDGLWNETGAFIKIIIARPWWATWWFRCLAAVSLLALVAGGYRLRVRSITRRNLDLETQVAQRTRSLSEQAAQLEAANKELEAFSYSVSHDLRAPLRSIDGFSQALLEDNADQLDSQGKDFLGRVRAASHRMERLIDDMLKLSRVTRSEMHRVTVDLSALAQTVARELQATQPERKVEFVIMPGLAAKADLNLMRVVLENLLGNAWKFTGKHSAARIELGVIRQNGQLACFVRDNGAGFDMAYAEKLFVAFQRLHSPADFEGTGIGLATVRRIIHRHGGHVRAEGKVEQGATFYFTLPE